MKIEFASPSDCNMLMRDAILYCLTYSRDGHKDWRMMTHDEMQRLTLQGYTFHHGTWAVHENITHEIEIDHTLFYNYVKSRVIPVRDI